MKQRSFLMLGMLLCGVFLLAACSTIASFFPDKQKQYRYSSDLPPLEIPPDLSSSSMEGVKVKEGTAEPASDSAATEEVSSEDREEAKPSRTESVASSDKPAASKRSNTTLAQDSSDEPVIEIEEPFAEAWNDVHRALGRLEIEVTDQNRSEHVFFVHYAGADHPKKSEDGGLWSDLKSLFSGPARTGEDFRIKLEPGERATNIYVLNTGDKVVTDGLGLELVKRLSDRLQKLDQAEHSTDDGEAESDKSH